MRVPLAETRFPTPELRAQFFSQLLERVQGLPGVRHAVVNSGLPIFGGRGSLVDLPEVSGTEKRYVMVHETSAGYLNVLGTQLTSGRVLEDADIRTAQRALWSEVQLVAEPGGAAALAALLAGAYRPAPGERVGVLVCGANTDPTTVAGPA